MSLYTKYRPKQLSEFAGNESVVESFDALFSKPRQDIPHAILLTGSPGCGKTTLARIAASRLGCSDMDLVEVDSADFRGIDTVRDIRRQMGLSPLGGPCRVWIIDECFAEGTRVRTSTEEIPIENVRVGDRVFSLFGLAKVKSVFRNEVPLHRLIKVKTSFGELFCTKDHLFLTDGGWKKAIDLNFKDLLLPFSRSIMNSKPIAKEDKRNDEGMFLVQEDVFSEKYTTAILFQRLCSVFCKKQKKSNSAYFEESNLQKMQFFFFHFFARCAYILRQGLCKCMERGQAKKASARAVLHNLSIVFYGEAEQRQRNMLQILWQYARWIEAERQMVFGALSKVFRCLQKIFGGKSCASKRIGFSIIQKDATEQSNEQDRSDRKNENYKASEWDAQCMERGTWGQWEAYSGAAVIERGFRMAYGDCSFDWTQFLRWIGISSQLQSRYRQRKVTDSGRSGWQGTSDEKFQVERYKENSEIEFIGVEGIEIYERGNNDESFFGIVSDKERDRGSIILYDLEIDGHPSYFANGCLVHNCHRQTSDAQAALLKALEDTPPHVYFMLATTDPQKLLPAILSRCTQLKVAPLGDDQIVRLLRHVAHQEGKAVPLAVLKQIALNSLGHPRAALVMLDKIIDLSAESMGRAVEQVAAEQDQVIDLCRALMKKSSWKLIAGILKGLKDQAPEDIRRAALGYCSAVLLSGEDPKAFVVMDAFRSPTYDLGWPGVVMACYEIIGSDA